MATHDAVEAWTRSSRSAPPRGGTPSDARPSKRDPMSVKSIVDRCESLFEDLQFTAVQEWKARRRDVRPSATCPCTSARDHPCGRHALRRHSRRRRPARGDPGDAYYRATSAGSRARPSSSGSRPARLPGRHAVPSICDVIRNLSGCGRSCSRTSMSATSTCRRSTRRGRGSYYVHELEILRDDLGKLRGKPITDDELRASIGVLNENRRAIRDLYTFRARTPWQARRRGLSRAARRNGATGRGAHEARARLHDRRGRREAPKRTTRASCLPRVLRAAAAGLIKSIEMAGCYIVEDDFMLVTRCCSRMFRRPAIRWRSCRRRSCTTPRPRRPSTTTGAKTRASSWWSRCVRRARRAWCSPRRRSATGAARAADAPGRSREAQDPVHRVQYAENTGRWRRSASRPALSRFDKAVERRVSSWREARTSPGSTARRVAQRDSMPPCSTETFQRLPRERSEGDIPMTTRLRSQCPRRRRSPSPERGRMWLRRSSSTKTTWSSPRRTSRGARFRDVLPEI